MAVNSSPSPGRTSLWTRIFGDGGTEYFLQQRFLPHWVPILLGVGLGIAAAGLLLEETWYLLFPLLFLVPAVVLFLTYPFVAVLIWALVFPFFVLEFGAGARNIYWLLHRAMIPSALILVLTMQMIGIKKYRPFRFGIAEVAMLSFLLLSVANILLLNQRPVATLIRFYDRIVIPFALYLLVRMVAPNERDLIRFVPVAYLIVLSQSLAGLLSWFAPHVLPNKWLGRLGERTVGTFGNPGTYTTTLVFAALILLQYFLVTRSPTKRLTALLTIGVALFFVFFSFSRGSWLGAMVVLVGLGFIYRNWIFRIGLTLGIVILGLVISLMGDYSSYAGERLMTQRTAEGRIIGGAATLRMVQAKPIFGWGYGNHELYDEQFRTRIWSLAITKEHSSHNTHLLIMAEMGLIGFFLYHFPLLWWFRRSLKMGKHLPPEGFSGRLMLFMFWLLLGDHLAVASFTDMFQSNLFAIGMWWMVLGLIANQVDASQERPGGLAARLSSWQAGPKGKTE